MDNQQSKKLIRELRDTTAHWVKGSGPFSHIVVSSRVRLARNLKDLPFPYKANDEQLREVLTQSEKFLNKNKHFTHFKIIKLDNLSETEIQFLTEKRLISITQAQLNYPNRAFAWNHDETVSIMFNEEDHLRIQGILPGFQIKKVWETIDCYDNVIEEELNYAFNENIGFLTCCPTNVGTGLRVSVMLHLPALVILNRLSPLLNHVSKIGYAVRGFYGEGTGFQGNLFQVSNQQTLGSNEKEIMNRLETLSNQLIDAEQKAREELMAKSKKEIEDQIMRAYGILTNAKMISTTEAVDLLSKIRFGIELGIILKTSYDIINQLMLVIQPGYLQLIKGKKMNRLQCDSSRASLIQELLN